jgi:hypothetical protein
MKIVEALHKIKHLKNKIQDLQSKISTYCAGMDVDKPTYENQEGQISEWLQSAHDSVKEVMRLKFAIQRTNISTNVTIEIGGIPVVHSISGWITRRVELAGIEKNTWECLTTKRLVPMKLPANPGEPPRVTNVKLYYNPKLKDKMVAEYSEEPALINAKLEVVNATTDLIE